MASRDTSTTAAVTTVRQRIIWFAVLEASARNQASGLYFDAILVRNHAGPNPMAVYLAGKFLKNKGVCLPVGYYKSASSGTHYKRDFIEFSSRGDPGLPGNQDTARAQAGVADELKTLLTKLEMAEVNNQLSGKLNNDDERRIIQTALQMGDRGGGRCCSVFTPTTSPTLDWEKRRQGYGVKIYANRITWA